MQCWLPKKANRVYVARNIEKCGREAQISADEDTTGFSFIASLKACAKQKDLLTGIRIHNDVVRRGLLANNVSIGNTLVSMYAKCGDLEKAQETFNALPVRNIVSWNALITGYVHHGCGNEAIDCFERMQLGSLMPDEVTFICILKACGSIHALDKGQEIHAQIVREKLLERHIVIANGMVDMYLKCGALEKAQEVFDQLLVWDVVSWNTLIAGYSEHRYGEEAVNCFDLMQLSGFIPNVVTFVCILKACGNIGAVEKGQEIHGQVLREHLLEKHIIVGNALVDMYVKCGALEKAQAVFDELVVRDVISWNSLIVGYAQHGQGEKAIKCYEQMQLGGQSPNVFTFACILKACGSIGAIGKGRGVHAQIVKENLIEKDIVVANALVDMYAKCGDLEKAKEVFDETPVRDIVSWTALIAGYAEHGYGEKALNCFEEMRLAGISPNAVTFASIVKACGIAGIPNRGQEIHSQIVKEHALEKDVLIGTALVDMYATCGMLAEAHELFDKLSNPDNVLWDVLMAGYAHHGKDEVVLNLFENLIRESIEPTLYTFTIVLNTCCRKGLLDKARMYFGLMSNRYGIIPTLEHRTCMVDLFGQVGHLDQAAMLIKEMPHSADMRIWLTLLGACNKWGDLKIGRWAFEQAVCLEEQDAAAYICMSNIYAAAGRQEDADKIKDMRVQKQAWKSLHFLLGN